MVRALDRYGREVVFAVGDVGTQIAPASKQGAALLDRHGVVLDCVREIHRHDRGDAPDGVGLDDVGQNRVAQLIVEGSSVAGQFGRAHCRGGRGVGGTPVLCGVECGDSVGVEETADAVRPIRVGVDHSIDGEEHGAAEAGVVECVDVERRICRWRTDIRSPDAELRGIGGGEFGSGPRRESAFRVTEQHHGGVIVCGSGGVEQSPARGDSVEVGVSAWCAQALVIGCDDAISGEQKRQDGR